ncbi:MAG: NADP(H)-dependent aldo-keto reductase [Cellvibrionaceae bacterium]
MNYRTLGNTGIDVSLIALGTMTYGEQNTQDEAFEQMDYAYGKNINFIDVAEMYPVPPRAETYGASETIVGNWIKSRNLRDKIVLATKVTGNGEHNAGFAHIRGGPRLSAAQIKQAVEGSLTRLQTDYIDLYQLHWPDRTTNFFGRLGYQHTEDEDAYSLQESLSAMADLLAEGKIRAVGLSNETPWGVMESCRVAAEYNLPRVASVQNPYNLLNRSYEVGLAEVSIREKIGLLAYSPLAFGVLSGKYLNGVKPENARLTLYSRFSRYTNAHAEAATAAYASLAKEHGLSLTDMSLAFVNQQPFLTANIIGATTMEQLAINIASVNVTLSNEVLEGIEAIHRQYSNPAP